MKLFSPSLVALLCHAPTQAAASTLLDSHQDAHEDQHQAVPEKHMRQRKLDSGVIEAFVFDDKAGDGIYDMDQDDEGIGGVTVNLYAENSVIPGNPVASTNTNEGAPKGVAVFGNVQPGTYRLEFVLPENHRFAARDAGTDSTNDDIDSDVNPNTGLTDPFTVSAGQEVKDIFAGMWTPGTVELLVFDDQDPPGNNQGIYNPGIHDKPLSGVTVRLLDVHNGQAVLSSEISGIDGTVSLGPVPADRPVRIEVDLPADHQFTVRPVRDPLENSNDNDVNPSTGLTARFSAFRGSHIFDEIKVGLHTPGSLVTRVWDESDAPDGVYMPGNGESGVGGVKVHMLDEEGNPVWGPLVAYTNAQGEAQFSYVPADRRVRLKYDLPADTKFTQRNELEPLQSSTDNDVKNVGKKSGLTHAFHADRGSQKFTEVSAGLWTPGVVEMFVFYDDDADGVYDPGQGDEAASEIDVALLESSGEEVLKTPSGEYVLGSTDDQGKVQLYFPADRAVRVGVTKPDGFGFTSRDQGSNDATDSDVNPNNGLTATFRATKGSETITSVGAGLIEDDVMD